MDALRQLAIAICIIFTSIFSLFEILLPIVVALNQISTSLFMLLFLVNIGLICFLWSCIGYMLEE